MILITWTKMNTFEITRLLTDEYSAKILNGTFSIPKSAIQLSRENGIPIAACYRRLKELEVFGLVRCVERVPTMKGKKIGLYYSQLKNAAILFEKGGMRVKLELLNGVVTNVEGDDQTISTA
jgi:hypothetical protein